MGWRGAQANTYSIHPTSNLTIIYINRERSKGHQLAVLAGFDDHQIFLAASSRRGVWTSMVIAILAFYLLKTLTLIYLLES